MDAQDLRARREQADYRDTHGDRDIPQSGDRLPHPTRSTPDGPPPPPRDREQPSGYTLMVAGRRTGKTSFLRLLLDTSVVSPTVTPDQLASVAKFVQGSAGFTSHVRTVSLNVDQPIADEEGRQELHTLNLTLIDTPCLDFEDEMGSQRVVGEILRHLDARFSESIEDVSVPSCSLPLCPSSRPLTARRTARPFRGTTMYTCE